MLQVLIPENCQNWFTDIFEKEKLIFKKSFSEVYKILSGKINVM